LSVKLPRTQAANQGDRKSAASTAGWGGCGRWRPRTRDGRCSIPSPEHRAHTCCCPSCGVATRARLPENVTAPVQYGTRIRALSIYLLHGHFVPQDRVAEVMGDLFGVRLEPPDHCSNEPQLGPASPIWHSRRDHRRSLRDGVTIHQKHIAQWHATPSDGQEYARSRLSATLYRGRDSGIRRVEYSHSAAAAIDFTLGNMRDDRCHIGN
jgi:hypothetical protein